MSPNYSFSPPSAPSGHRRTGKREAMMDAARIVFGREGYGRTSIDMIAREARVSTRTVYNHFPDGKQQLFSAVVLASATQVADGFLHDVQHQLTGEDPLADLLALGRACGGLRTASPEHFAMIEQIEAEAPQFPPATVDQWRQAGPLRVLHEVAHRLQQLADQGLLRIEDPIRAALHFSALVTAGLTSYYGAPALSDEQRTTAVADGVEAFLHGYSAP